MKISDFDKLNENLHDWFGKEKWVRMDTKGNIKGPCARGSDSEGKPKCLPQAKAHALGRKGRASAAQKKRRQDPDPERSGKAINVATRVKEEELDEKWSQKYKKSINCSHPKGFSQKAHCAGKRKHNEDIEQEMTCPDCGMCETHGDHSRDTIDEACWKGYHKEGMKTMFGKRYPNCVKNEAVAEGHESCPECGGAMYPDTMINEKQDACYYKVKSRYKVWPSAYASGALVQCRKKGAKNWGNKNESLENTMDELSRIVELGTGLSLEARAELNEEFDLIERIIENLAEHNGVDAEVIWEDLESLSDDELYVFAVTQPIMEDLDEMDRRGFLKSMGAGAALAGASSLGANTAFAQSMPNINTQKLNLANKYYAALVQRAKEDGLPLDTRTKNMLKAKAEEMATRQLQQTQSSYPGAQSSEIKRSNNYNQFESEAWQKANNRDKTDGMSRKAVKTYRREHPGSKLQTAVTTKPSKLKKGSKASKRRKSYCSRSKGQMKMHNISCAKTPDKAICKARRRWNC